MQNATRVKGTSEHINSFSFCVKNKKQSTQEDETNSKANATSWGINTHINSRIMFKSPKNVEESSL